MHPGLLFLTAESEPIDGKVLLIVVGTVFLLLILVTFYVVSKCRSGIMDMLEFDEGYEEREREFEEQQAAARAAAESTAAGEAPSEPPASVN